MDFERALLFVLKREGGYVDDPDDRGGATNCGVTQATYDRWRRLQHLPARPVREITKSEITSVYRDLYWNPSRAPEMPDPLALAYFDGYVNHRPRDVGRALQRAVNRVTYGKTMRARLTVDGIVGSKTLALIGDADPIELTREFLWQRNSLYRRIADRDDTQLKFLLGWIRRLEHVWDTTYSVKGIA